MATSATPRIARLQRAELLDGVYAIVNEGPRLLQIAQAALEAGIRIVQYRAKTSFSAENVGALRALTQRRRALLIVNDDWRAAAQLDCDGVHLGPGDSGFDCVAAVREALPDRLIGLSCGTLDEVRRANGSDADYLGAGSVYATRSKSDAGAPIGIAALQALVEASAVPVAAIGGITPEKIADVRRTGAAMAAVISALAGPADPARAAADLVAAWDGARAPTER